MYEYYRDAQQLPILGKITKVTLGFAIVTALVTLRGLVNDPYLVRRIKSTGEFSSAMSAQGIGGYELVYFATLGGVIALSVLLMTPSIKTRISAALLYLLSFVLIVLSNYFTALLVAIAALVIALGLRARSMNRKSLGLLAIPVACCVLVLIVVLMVPVASPLGEPTSRMNRIKYAATDGIVAQYLNQRGPLLLESLESAVEHPLLGLTATRIEMYEGYLTGFGQHSHIFDTFALFGFPAGLVSIYVLFMPFKRRLKNKRMRVLSVPFVFSYAVILFFNNATPSLAIAAYFIFPLVFDRIDETTGNRATDVASEPASTRSIKYIAYYDTADNVQEQRNYVLAATNKLEYVFTALNRNGLRVEIVSACTTRGPGSLRGKTSVLGDQNTLKLFPTLSGASRFTRMTSRASVRVMLFVYLILHTKRHEDVVVYHSPGYPNLIVLAKKMKGFRLILEVEEIYADVNGESRLRAKEYRVFEQADAFILPTELLEEKLNVRNRPTVIVHGTYQLEAERDSAFDDGRIHVVYAGTFDPRKGGASAAVAAAEFLDARHHVHIIGFGGERDTQSLLTLIDDVSAKTECRVTYDGLLAGEEYIDFLQSCDIGLSTQRLGTEFNETSFPSKVLSYMANGLQVVSVRLKVLEASGVGDLIFYYETDTPEAIAGAIKTVDLGRVHDSRTRISSLDADFLAGLRKVLSR
ncbi:MAG: glycosyltransferase [Actinomycetota bacterium]|nr:glycosyltransferase [Actinomycetota bacterium]